MMKDRDKNSELQCEKSRMASSERGEAMRDIYEISVNAGDVVAYFQISSFSQSAGKPIAPV